MRTGHAGSAHAPKSNCAAMSLAALSSALSVAGSFHPTLSVMPILPPCSCWYLVRYTLAACACARLTLWMHRYGSVTLSPAQHVLRSEQRPGAWIPAGWHNR